MYKVKQYIKTINWEGAIIEDQEGNRYITNGVYKWEARPERVRKCELINTIDKDNFLKLWNRNIGIYDNIELV